MSFNYLSSVDSVASGRYLKTCRMMSLRPLRMIQKPMQKKLMLEATERKTGTRRLEIQAASPQRMLTN